MAVILGEGEFTYEATENWAKLPDGWEFGDAAAIGVDRHDRVYVFNRGEHPMIVFDRDGNFLDIVGRGRLPPPARRAHGAGRLRLLHRRRRPHRAQVHARRQGAARRSAFPASRRRS